MLYCGIQDTTDIVDMDEVGEERAEVCELGIVWIVEP